MKKTLLLAVLLGIAVSVCAFFICVERRNTQFVVGEDGLFYIECKAASSEKAIYPYYDAEEDVYYFLLPSFAEEKRIHGDKISGGELSINGSLFERYDTFRWKDNTDYLFVCRGVSRKVRFLKSANLPAVFIATQSGSMDSLNETKEYEETGDISVVSVYGNEEYKGDLSRISGRGNTTFYKAPQKSYSFSLENAAALCGLEYGRKWNLLSTYFQNDLIRSKIVFDMAEYLGMEFTPECTWVDLYCNGEYMGIYLLSEPVAVAEGRVDITDLDKANVRSNPGYGFETAAVEREESCSFYDIDSPDNITGGYLLEKTPEERIESGECFFKLDTSGYHFTVKSPSYASKEETRYIHDYMQNIEELILDGDTGYRDYLDMESFAKQYLIDKVSMENDAMFDSTFFYKEADSDVLKAGPIWDRDRTFGTGSKTADYCEPIEGEPDAMALWYDALYQDEEFRGLMISYYEELLPYMEEIVETRIDSYADLLSQARKMNDVLLKASYRASTWTYVEYDNQVKYIKYYIANRCNYLSALWGVEGGEFAVPQTTGEIHTVTLYDENLVQIGSFQVKDGECLSPLPKYDAEKYEGWEMNGEGRLYADTIPIYEDLDLYLTVREDAPVYE